MMVSVWLQSCWGPSHLAPHSNHRSWESLRNYIGCPSSEQLRACSNILSKSLSGRPHWSQQPSSIALSSRAIFLFLWIWLLFIHKTHPLAVYLSCEKAYVFLRATTFHLLSDSVKTLTNLQDVFISTCWIITVCELLQIVDFDGLTFLTASVLFNQSDYLKHFLIGLL